MTSIIAAIKAIPELVSLVSKLVDTVRDLVDAYQKKKEVEWIEKGNEIIAQIKRASNDKERAELAEKLSRLIGNIP